jgi:DNA-binding NarL/FixJ family response regulator
MRLATILPPSSRKEKKSRIKVLLTDDHPFIRAGVRCFLLKHEQFEVVGEASNGPEAIAQARELSPDVVVMDLEMPGGDGLEATERLREICPRSRVLILSMKEQKDLDRNLIQSGAKGYLRKDASPLELVSALEAIHRGETCFRPEVAQAFFNHYVLSGGKLENSSPKRLSPREQEVLNGIVEGLANKEIADRMQIRTRTVEKHRQRMMSKLKVHKATELVKYALTRGFVTLNAA